MQIILYVLGCLFVSGIFAWFMASLLDMVSIPLVNTGVVLHKSMKQKPADEKGAWLFTLLISVTRVPVIFLATATFLFYLLSLLLPQTELLLTEQLLWSTCLIIFIMREGSILFGSVIFGSSMRDIIKTLHG